MAHSVAPWPQPPQAHFLSASTPHGLRPLICAGKVHEGGTPSPALGTSALPGERFSLFTAFAGARAVGVADAMILDSRGGSCSNEPYENSCVLSSTEACEAS